MALPELFCWTRFGAEAGQSIEEILNRKEKERLSNGGVFFWGIGNALGPSMAELIRRFHTPEVLFSPIRSAPRAADVSPSGLAAWVWGLTLDGEGFRLPGCSFVTSRHDPHTSRGFHYALVCRSDVPLVDRQVRMNDKIPLGALRNLRTGRRIGASQVTAIVRYHGDTADVSPAYNVAMRARLVPPYFIRLQDPLAIPRVSGNQELANVVHEAVEQRARSSSKRTVSGTLLLRF